MKIQELFERNIHRAINGVVKADQVDASSVWQELDEFVVTRELTRHIHDLVSLLMATIESDPDALDRNGIWISGFFGCGKSHLIKVLSYLVQNDEHEHEGERRRAVDFFADKLDDAVLFGDLEKVVNSGIDAILFNIDSKADHRAGRAALLQVFLKVLNEKQGYSGDHPHIAHMERHLEEIGKLDVFHASFERASGEPWLAQRDAWAFHRDAVVAALRDALGQSESSVEKWVDSGADHFSLTVENFARWVKHYLDKQGPDRRIMFLVDEVGQFIGNDTHLMLNLQTITEELCTICRGRAWVVVTSQEDLDAVLGDLKNTKQHDFSKIQGRFKTRLSLSSANVDEVIKERLLRKNESAVSCLAEAYEGKQDILRNQLSFVKAGMSFKSYGDTTDFATCYPFAAYQFTLVQKVFESIRKAGATGLHLSQGERSTLDAFQSAARQVGGSDVGVLVPFHRFYPSVEGFLDTGVKRTIDQAGDNHALEDFDTTVLQVLFLIRYVDEVPGNVDNLVTLCVNEIDADRLALRKTIEGSLARLEAETLIARNGDLYFFLTNEERDIGREIKNTPVPSGAEARELGKLLFEDILSDVRKHTYHVTGREFAFTRLCDDHPVGHRIEGNLEVSFVTPLGDDYGQYIDDSSCDMRSASDGGRVLIRLPDDPDLGRELRTYLQTEAYVKTRHTGSLPEPTRRILRDRTEENRARRSRIVQTVKSMLANARYFVAGHEQNISRTDPKDALGDALDYLIQNTFPKMGYIQTLRKNPKQEIQSTLRANDVEKLNLDIDPSEVNPKALEELREYVRLCAMTSKQILLRDLIEVRFGRRPYGWPELEVVLLVARLAVLNEIHLLDSASKTAIPLDQAYDPLTSPSKQKKVIITQRKSAGGELIKQAQDLGKELFAAQGPGSEEGLFSFLSEKLASWNRDLESYDPLASTGKYPGRDEIRDGLASLRMFVEEQDSLRFLQRLVENRAKLLDLADDVHDLHDFYTHQKPSWEKLRDAVDELSQNRLQLGDHADAGPAFRRLEEILQAKRPYDLLPEVADLEHRARAANDRLVADARSPAVAEIQGLVQSVTGELDRFSATDAIRDQATGELSKLLHTAVNTRSIAHIAEALNAAGEAYNRALAVIEESQASSPKKPGGSPGVTPPAPRVKKRRVVEVRTLWSGAFIENEADLDAFLKKLRATMKHALDAGERVQIR